MPGLLLGKPLACSACGWRDPELFGVTVVREKPFPVYREDHTHLTARETGSHELRAALYARGPHRQGKDTRLPANFDGQIYHCAYPPNRSPGGEGAMGKK